MVVELMKGMAAHGLLHRAVSNADKDTISDLIRLREDLDVNCRDAANGHQTALMRLCRIHLESVSRCQLLQLLIDRGADVNLQDSAGRSALAHACIAERADVIQLLAKTPECDPNIADADGNTALIYAVRSRKPDVVRHLLGCFKGGILEVNCRNSKGLSALTEAESRYDGEICRLLINEGGADPMQMDTFQFSRASRSPRTAAAEVLPTSLPNSPRIHARQRNKKSYSFELSPGSSQSRMPAERPVDVHFMWRENRSRSSSRSFDSNSTGDCESETSLAEVEEVDEEEEEAMLEECGSLLKRRRNSRSLPDLREISVHLISASSPNTSPKPYDGDTYPKSGQRYERCSLTMDDVQSLPEVSEEEEEEEEDSPSTPPKNLDQRRGSLSLPDLRDCAFLVSNQNDKKSGNGNGNGNGVDEHGDNEDDDDDDAFAPASPPLPPVNHKRLLQIRSGNHDCPQSVRLPQLCEMQPPRIGEACQKSSLDNVKSHSKTTPPKVFRTKRVNLAAIRTIEKSKLSSKDTSPR